MIEAQVARGIGHDTGTGEFVENIRAQASKLLMRAASAVRLLRRSENRLPTRVGAETGY